MGFHVYAETVTVQEAVQSSRSSSKLSATYEDNDISPVGSLGKENSLVISEDIRI